jgi:hypothetical protein
MYILIEFCIEIGCDNAIEGSNVAFESMKIYFDLAYLHKFTQNGPECAPPHTHKHASTETH